MGRWRSQIAEKLEEIIEPYLKTKKEEVLQIYSEVFETEHFIIEFIYIFIMIKL